MEKHALLTKVTELHEELQLVLNKENSKLEEKLIEKIRKDKSIGSLLEPIYSSIETSGFDVVKIIAENYRVRIPILKKLSEERKR
jgi:hypothetical protein